MINKDTSNLNSSSKTMRFGWLKLLGIVVTATIIATVIAVWAVKYYIFPNELKPVTLSTKEEQILNAKIERLSSVQKTRVTQNRQPGSTGEIPPVPERYSEEASSREIVLSEKELNALLAKNPDLAKKLAIDLSNNLASATLLLPLDKDFPLGGDKTLKVTAGLELAYADGKPIVALKGVSIWGVPLPNAWLGNLKNVDLVKEFGVNKGFWNAFAAGVDDIKIKEGSLRIKLKE